MDGTIFQFLHYLSEAMGQNGKAEVSEKGIFYDQLFMLSQIHHVAPLVYPVVMKSLAASKEYEALGTAWRRFTISQAMEQYHATQIFLQIYEKLTKAGIKALVVKGIILRQLYPEPDSRKSSDEDIYINESDFLRVHQILTEAGLETDMVDGREPMLYEIVYTMKDSRWKLEIHTTLFDTNIKFYSDMNDCFVDAFDRSIAIKVNESEIFTLSHTHHLLFLLLHTIKHFCGSGVGIRQICDIVMYCNAFGQEVDFDFIWKQLTELGVDILALNLFDIGVCYLGLDPLKYHIPSRYGTQDIHTEALLQDVIGSGIYGKSKPDQGEARISTLNSIIRNRSEHKEAQKYWLIWRALFPSRQTMGYQYRYCQDHPSLIMVAWFHRIINYVQRVKMPGRIIYKVVMQVHYSGERIKLMKEYKVINS